METERVRWHATRTLQLAVNMNTTELVTAVHEMIAEIGEEDMFGVLLAWLDTLIEKKNLGHGRDIGLVWKDIDTGDIQGADDLTAEEAWVGQLLAARCRMDWEMFQALMMAVPDGKQGRYVRNVLEVVAWNIRLIMQGRTG